MNLAQAIRNSVHRPRAALLARLAIVLVALMHGWGSYASAVSFSHDPVPWTDHAGVATQSHSSGHDHGHDEARADGDESELQGGHDAVDHSHDKPNLARDAAHSAASPTDDWSMVHLAPSYPSPLFAFDRPPKPLPLQ